MSNLEITPELRFSEFSKKWKATKLINHSTSVMYGMNSSAIEYDGKHGYIRITDIDEDNCFSPNPITSPDGVIQDKFRLNRGDIVFARTGANTGKSYLYKESDGEIYFAGFLIKASIINAIPEFIFQNTFRPRYDNWVHIMSMRSGQPGINAEEYKSYSFNIPEDVEQQKIADFFSSVDKEISLLKAKHTLFEQYKKGVMQQLFSQEIRFKDKNGNNFPDWEKNKLGCHLIEYKERSKIENEYEVLTSSRSGLMKQSDYYNEGRITERSNKGFNIIPENYMTFRSRSDDRKFFFNLNKLGLTGIISTYYPVFKMKNEQNGFFIELTRYHKNVFGKYAVGTSQVVLSTTEFLKIKLDFPCTMEQNRISKFASELDEKIQLVSQQIEKIKTFKKGLLQQMFV